MQHAAAKLRAFRPWPAQSQLHDYALCWRWDSQRDLLVVCSGMPRGLLPCCLCCAARHAGSAFNLLSAQMQPFVRWCAGKWHAGPASAVQVRPLRRNKRLHGNQSGSNGGSTVQSPEQEMAQLHAALPRSCCAVSTCSLNCSHDDVAAVAQANDALTQPPSLRFSSCIVPRCAIAISSWCIFVVSWCVPIMVCI